MTEQEVTAPQQEPTPEEIREMRDRMHEYYKDQIPFLESQKEYETLLSEIEIARLRRIDATLRIAQLTAPPQEQKEAPEEKKGPRRLKSEE